MRPQSIVGFQWLMLGTLALGLVQTWLAWGEMVQLAGVGTVLTIQVLTFALMIGLVLLVCYRRSRIAMWVLIAFFAIGLYPFLKMAMAGMLAGAALISIVQIIGQAVAIGLLFTPSARAWMGTRSVTA